MNVQEWLHSWWSAPTLEKDMVLSGNRFWTAVHSLVDSYGETREKREKGEKGSWKMQSNPASLFEGHGYQLGRGMVARDSEDVVTVIAFAECLLHLSLDVELHILRYQAWL